MGLVHSVRERVVGDGESWSSRRRAQRWQWLLHEFPGLAEMSVLDLGGYPSTWTRSPVHPRRVHVVNIEPLTDDLPDWIEVDHGDACALPRHIAERRYDLVFSNSVIEHVGGHERRLRFAESVHLLAPEHWVQTPYRYFPVEPHWIAPGMQFLPVRMRATVARRWPLAHVRSANLHDALTGVLWTELVDRSQMRYYFPESTLRSERLFGLTKSLIAVRHSR
jgi:hypothetical protein